jgi:hypothetical protein
VKGWRNPFFGQEKTRLFCGEDQVVLYIWPRVSLVFFFRRRATVQGLLVYFKRKGK